MPGRSPLSATARPRRTGRHSTRERPDCSSALPVGRRGPVPSARYRLRAAAIPRCMHGARSTVPPFRLLLARRPERSGSKSNESSSACDRFKTSTPARGAGKIYCHLARRSHLLVGLRRSLARCRRGRGPCLLFLVEISRKPFEFFQKNERSVRRDLEALAARLTDEVVVNANQMVLRLAEEHAIALVRAGGNLSFLGTAQPLD